MTAGGRRRHTVVISGGGEVHVGGPVVSGEHNVVAGGHGAQHDAAAELVAQLRGMIAELAASSDALGEHVVELGRALDDVRHGDERTAATRLRAAGHWVLQLATATGANLVAALITGHPGRP